MSRSFKRNPIFKQEKVSKRRWNKKVRRVDLDTRLHGGQFKRVVTDDDNWNSYWSLEDAIRDYEPSESFPTLESFIEYWKSCCLRK